MDIVNSIIDASWVAVDLFGGEDKATNHLNAQGARELMGWLGGRHSDPTEAAKYLFNAGWCFLSAAATAGIDVRGSWAELLRQTEEYTGGAYLDSSERHQAEEKRREAAPTFPSAADILRAIASSRAAA